MLAQASPSLRRGQYSWRPYLVSLLMPTIALQLSQRQLSIQRQICRVCSAARAQAHLWVTAQATGLGALSVHCLRCTEQQLRLKL